VCNFTCFTSFPNISNTPILSQILTIDYFTKALPNVEKTQTRKESFKAHPLVLGLGWEVLDSGLTRRRSGITSAEQH